MITKKLKIIFWLFAIIAGALQVWAFKHTMNHDAINYLDIADFCSKGNLGVLINSFLSPLYAALVALFLYIFRPDYYWEFPVVHLADFVIYILTLCCFEFFLRQLIKFYKQNLSKRPGLEMSQTTETAFISIGYILFIWSSLKLITVHIGGPDMLVAAFMYLITGIVLWILNGRANRIAYALFGISLGFGYLAKAIMFPLSFVFIAVICLSKQSARQKLSGLAVSMIAYAFIAAPYVVLLSKHVGRPTFGESWNHTYAVYVLELPWYWHGEPQGSGIPVNPIKKIHNNPIVLDYSLRPVGTSARSYEPSFWSEGQIIKFDLKKQIKRWGGSALFLYNIIFNHYIVIILAAITAFLIFKNYKVYLLQWVLFITPVAGFILYASCNVSERFFGSFFTIVWLVLLSPFLFIPDEKEKLVSKCLLYSIAIIMCIKITFLVLNNLREGPAGGAKQIEIAKGLMNEGVKPGDKIGAIKSSSNLDWIRMTKTTMVAELFDVKTFWGLPDKEKAGVLESFMRSGVKAVVIESPPFYAIGRQWKRIGNTDHYLLVN
ncbi:MAG: hypothetical protein HY606_12945 [Planctomycetes bacterium]|nr:hypothetical protein [Planctomycetota bacterium]